MRGRIVRCDRGIPAAADNRTVADDDYYANSIKLLSMIVMMLMMVIFWGVVIVGIVLGIRWLASQGKEPRSTDTALDIVRQRYARGEINKEEFEAKKRDLM